MTIIHEGNLTFSFQQDWKVSSLDQWPFYRKRFQSVCGGTKAVDILAISPNKTAWFIEVKDYRAHRRTKAIELPDEIAIKARDSLACVYAAAANTDDAEEKEIAVSALGATKIRVVLHLEQPQKHSKLFPRSIDPAHVKQKLRQVVKAIDAHPKVVEKGRMESCSWQVQ